jgi:UDP-N-acetylmuramate--alanine ligase
MMDSLRELRDLHIHFVGIGGAGMSGIARIMIAQGLAVSGSDVKTSGIIDSLENLGAKIFIGHQAENIKGSDLLISSGAVGDDNVELAAAQESGIPTWSRAEALSQLMREKKSVAIAGTHGKTTTTSMLTVALQVAGLDPSFSIGGLINSSGLNAHLGSGDIFVAEADESDGSFTLYHPWGAIITNIELDHVDHFGSLEEVFQAFLAFVTTIQPGGFLVACGDDPGVVQLLSRIGRQDIRIMTYGKGECDYVISRISCNPTNSIARISHTGKILDELFIAIPGEHNIYNACAALAAGELLGANGKDLTSGLATYSGTRRRFEYKASVNGITVLDDYGHHPTEIRVTLETAQRYAQAGKVLVIFQPHRFSRTQAFASEFNQALGIADRAFILEIYPASEQPIPGVTSALIARGADPSKISVEPSMIKAVENVVELAQAGDVIITLGAGDVSALAPAIIQALEEKY